MFSEYVVVFVGYSHSDVVMKYLGLGVGPRSQRYVLTDQPGDPLWTRLGVVPLEYPHQRHDILSNCLQAWADLGEMGLLDHRQRVRDIVASGPVPREGDRGEALTLPPDELSYLQNSIRRTDRVKFFCEFAKDVFWLEWAAKEEPFARLFDRSAPDDDEVARFLGHWFVSSFVMADEERSERAWRTVAAAGGVFGNELWDSLAWGFAAADEGHPDHVLRWLWLLMDQDHAGRRGTEFLDMAINKDEVWADQDLRLALLAHMMRPRLAPVRMLDAALMDVATRADIDALDTVWRDRCIPELSVLAPAVLPVAETALRQHLTLELRLGRSRFGFDRHRSAIQPHEQNRHRDPIDAVIDAVRDCAVELWVTQPDALPTIVDGWMSSDFPLMRRLAVHVVGASPAWTPDRRVQFVLDRNLPSDHALSQEVFHLLGAAAKDATPEVVERLVAAYSTASADEGEQYQAYSALEWLERSGVEHENLTLELASLRQALGDVQAEQDPGLRSWVHVGWIQSSPPLTTDEFDARVRESAEDAVAFVLSFDERTYSATAEPTREDAVTMLRSTVEKRAHAGVEVWPFVADHHALRHAIVSAWGHATDLTDLVAVMDILLGEDLKTLLPAVGQFLMQADRANGAAWEKLRATDVFMDRVWEACANSDLYEPEHGRDWMSDTINTPAGLLMDFWFEMFRRRWVAAGDGWSGLPEPDREFLGEALADGTKRGAYALTQIGGRLHFLDAADEEWCRARVLPLRDWGAVRVAEPFWWGVLSMARWNSGLVESGLLDGLIDTSRHLQRFGEEQRRRWADMLASVAVRSESPDASSWVDRFAATAGGEDRARWIGAVADELKDLDEAGRDRVWTGWLGDFWQRRTVSDPVALTDAEASAFAAVALYVPSPQFAAAVDLVTTTRAGFDVHASLARQVPDELIDAEPDAAGRFLNHLMSNTPKPSWVGYSLKPKLARVIAHQGDWAALRDAALRLDVDLQ